MGYISSFLAKTRSEEAGDERLLHASNSLNWMPHKIDLDEAVADLDEVGHGFTERGSVEVPGLLFR